MSVADARSDLERHSSLRSAGLSAEISSSSTRALHTPSALKRAAYSPSEPPVQLIQAPVSTVDHFAYGSGTSTPKSDSQRRRQPGQIQPARPLIGSPRAKRPSFSSDASQLRQAAWQ